jgi:hypothetical protein
VRVLKLTHYLQGVQKQFQDAAVLFAMWDRG